MVLYVLRCAASNFPFLYLMSIYTVLWVKWYKVVNKNFRLFITLSRLIHKCLIMKWMIHTEYPEFNWFKTCYHYKLAILSIFPSWLWLIHDRHLISWWEMIISVEHMVLFTVIATHSVAQDVFAFFFVIHFCCCLYIQIGHL